ncbi:fimbrial biogenesis chaperone [Jiella mangrovi]|uniref:Molecular chaperone n=1 Tax=Jiella mangrovi TaxID=2821407 RepID=A0ABS4BGG3_9HYPH|nr:fimbria/pilus periplasmic chaperone [Jiella mangrovi]MBP0615839.1 molecular chaperone [Jiella mangrovi]
MGFRRFSLAVGIAVSLMLAVGSGNAASLRVSPISLDLPHGTKASSVRVWNNDRQPVTVQARIFRWTRKGGKDILSPTRDVVVSPPIATLAPGAENVIRIVRTSNRPVEGREAYRLIVDQIPDRSHDRPGTVRILVRHAIAVIFK